MALVNFSCLVVICMCSVKERGYSKAGSVKMCPIVIGTKWREEIKSCLVLHHFILGLLTSPPPRPRSPTHLPLSSSHAPLLVLYSLPSSSCTGSSCAGSFAAGGRHANTSLQPGANTPDNLVFPNLETYCEPFV